MNEIHQEVKSKKLKLDKNMSQIYIITISFFSKQDFLIVIKSNFIYACVVLCFNIHKLVDKRSLILASFMIQFLMFKYERSRNKKQNG